MGSVERSAFRYSFEVAPTAWAQVGVLPADIFQRMRRELERVAARAWPQTLGQAPSRELPSPWLRVDEYVARYEIDHDQRLITLVNIARHLPRP